MAKHARGYRKETSDQILLLIDGIAMNHLYSNNMNLFAMYSLSNVLQIEVIYCPVSAIYGPNAFAGVINIITKKDGKSTVSMFAGQTYYAKYKTQLKSPISENPIISKTLSVFFIEDYLTLVHNSFAMKGKKGFQPLWGSNLLSSLNPQASPADVHSLLPWEQNQTSEQHANCALIAGNCYCPSVPIFFKKKTHIFQNSLPNATNCCPCFKN